MIYDLDGMLPARAFQRDASGQIKPQAGGGGSQTPTNQNVTTTSIPEYARPYVEKSLGQASALTDINQNPYQPYGGQRTAAFTPLQAQAMQNVSGMQTAPQITDASNLAYTAGQQGLGALGTSQQLQGTALGYGQAGAGYGAAASQFGAQGAMDAQRAAQQAQQQASMYGAQGSMYGGMGAGFGQQASNYGASAAGLAPAAQMYGAQGAGYGAQGADQALQAQRAAEAQADVYGQMGAGFGAQASSLAPEAQGYGAGAAQLGMAGMGFGAEGSDIGRRGVSAAEQGFGAGEAYRQQATSADAMGQYMSPYMQNVVDVQQKDAMRQAEIARQGTQAQAVKAGAFGGSRSAIVEAENQRGLQDRLAQIQATGSQAAYDKAQQAQQFASTTGLQGLQAGYQGLQTGMQGTAQGMQGAQTGIQGQQAGMQGVGQAGQMYGLGMQGAGLGLQGTGQRLQAAQVGLQGTGQGIQGSQAGLAGIGQAGQMYGMGIQGSQAGIQGAQAGMQGAQTGLQGVGQQIAGGQLGLSGAGMGIQGQQAGMQGTAQGLAGVQAATGAGQYGLQGAGAATSAAGTLGQLGQTQFGQEAAITDAQMRAGQLQQSEEQKGMDLQYQQYLESLNYPYKQLGFMSDMYRGLPLSQSTQAQYQAAPPASQQMLGLGLGAAGMYKAFS